MKVIDLVAQLSILPEYSEVYMSSDDEGNSFHPVYEIEETTLKNYTDDTTFPGVIIWPGWQSDVEPF